MSGSLIVLTRGPAVSLFVSLALSFISVPAPAHQAKSGWAYPYACCSNKDCREIPADLVSERPEGYVLEPTGEVVGYSDHRVRQSPDGVYHWCSVAGKDNSRTICLFVPPRLF